MALVRISETAALGGDPFRDSQQKLGEAVWGRRVYFARGERDGPLGSDRAIGLPRGPKPFNVRSATERDVDLDLGREPF